MYCQEKVHESCIVETTSKCGLCMIYPGARQLEVDTASGDDVTLENLKKDILLPVTCLVDKEPTIDVPVKSASYSSATNDLRRQEPETPSEPETRDILEIEHLSDTFKCNSCIISFKTKKELS